MAIIYELNKKQATITRDETLERLVLMCSIVNNSSFDRMIHMITSESTSEKSKFKYVKSLNERVQRAIQEIECVLPSPSHKSE